MSSSWQDDPFAFDGGFDDGFDDGFDQAVTGGAPAKKGNRRLTDGGVLALCLTAVLGAVIAVVMGASEAGWLTVAVGVLAYLAAAAGDLRQRSIRHRKRKYERPWPTAALRVVVFLAAAVAAWLAARGLATP
ncbi:MAG: hypothetical protein OXC00_08900 [Acidimicrobiaceae bacterium]|nr:hypothetical protein [Acidimicrobiaceae bacterium]